MLSRHELPAFIFFFLCVFQCIVRSPQEFVRKLKEMIDTDSDKAKIASSDDPPADGETLERSSSCRRCVPGQGAAVRPFHAVDTTSPPSWSPPNASPQQKIKNKIKKNLRRRRRLFVRRMHVRSTPNAVFLVSTFKDSSYCRRLMIL